MEISRSVKGREYDDATWSRSLLVSFSSSSFVSIPSRSLKADSSFSLTLPFSVESLETQPDRILLLLEFLKPSPSPTLETRSRPESSPRLLASSLDTTRTSTPTPEPRGKDRRRSPSRRTDSRSRTLVDQDSRRGDTPPPRERTRTEPTTSSSSINSSSRSSDKIETTFPRSSTTSLPRRFPWSLSIRTETPSLDRPLRLRPSTLPLSTLPPTECTLSQDHQLPASSFPTVSSNDPRSQRSTVSSRAATTSPSDDEEALEG